MGTSGKKGETPGTQGDLVKWLLPSSFDKERARLGTFKEISKIVDFVLKKSKHQIKHAVLHEKLKTVLAAMSFKKILTSNF